MPLQANYRDVADMLEELTTYIRTVTQYRADKELSELDELLTRSEVMIEKAKL